MNNDYKNNSADKLIDEVLKTEPTFYLPHKFADKVAKSVERKFEWNLYLKEFLIYLATFVGIIAISVAMVFIWFSANITEWQTILIDNISWIIGINVVLIFILFADRVVLRYFIFNSIQNKSANF